MINKYNERKLISYDIYNFEHGYEDPFEVKIDESIKIRITKEHCCNLDKIYTNKKRRYKYDQNLERKIEMDKESSFTWNVTATILIEEDKLFDSMIAPGPNRTIINDLCYLLSFYTGRIVCTVNDTEIYSYKKFTSSIIQDGKWADYITNYKAQIDSICSNKLNNTFYNILHLFQQSELLSIGFYSSAIVNDLYSKWWTKQPKIVSKSDTKKIKEQVSIEIKKVLEKEMSEELYNDIYIRFAQSLSNPSAHYQLYNFLRSFCIDTDNDKIKNRVKLFNQVRNRIVHSGDLYRDKKKSEDLNVTMNVNLVTVLTDIIKVYFCQSILYIDSDFQVAQYIDKLNNFFKSGKYNGMDIFNETFDDYYKRLDEIWLNIGNLQI